MPSQCIKGQLYLLTFHLSAMDRDNLQTTVSFLMTQHSNTLIFTDPQFHQTVTGILHYVEYRSTYGSNLQVIKITLH
jgi:hypothetical protein